MASYRYAASIIKRSEGRSATAAAAYRAAEAIADLRTGIIHDYSRKGGVIHSEVMTPEGTPDWMMDRTRLWNAVEAAEKRKDSQLAREIQLSLPHELTDAQRLELVRTFAADAFVSRGIIADIAIHRPDKDRDNRNHHAHIMLTTRTLTSEGFGPKIRQEMEAHKEQLKEERRLWENYQNRALEKAGARDRVDHRSFKDRGIDRDPTVHMGPFVSKLEDKGEQTRRGDQNREILVENARRAEEARQKLMGLPPLPRRPANDSRPRPMTPDFNKDRDPKTRAEKRWAERDHQRRVALEDRERHSLLDLDRKHQPAKLKAADEFDKRVQPFVATISEELKAIDRRLEARGVNRFFRNVFGKTRADEQAKALHQKTLEAVEQRKAEELKALETRQNAEKIRMIERYRHLKDNLEREIRQRFEKIKESQDVRRPEADKPPRLPKLSPTMQPRPPNGADGPLFPRDRKAEEQRMRDYIASPEGRRQGHTPISTKQEHNRVAKDNESNRTLRNPTAKDPPQQKHQWKEGWVARDKLEAEIRQKVRTEILRTQLEGVDTKRDFNNEAPHSSRAKRFEWFTPAEKLHGDKPAREKTPKKDRGRERD